MVDNPSGDAGIGIDASEAERQDGTALTRRQIVTRGTVAASLMGAGGLLAACGGSGASATTSSGSGGRKLRIVTVWVGIPGTAFFVRTKNGALQAGHDLSPVLTSEYKETTSGKFDVNEVNRLFDTVVAGKPDGIVTFVSDAVAQRPHIRRAVDAGIPVVLTIAEAANYRELGAIAYFGADNAAGGAAAAKRMKSAGVTSVLVVNQNPQDPGVNSRYTGFKQGFEALGGKVKMIPVVESDVTGMKNKTQAALVSSSDVDGIYSLGASSGETSLAAVKELGKVGKIQLGNWDLSPIVLEAISGGQILFAHDQQPFLDTYSAVVAVYLYKQFGVVPSDQVQTGPAFVTKDNASQVIALSKQGIR